MLTVNHILYHLNYLFLILNKMFEMILPYEIEDIIYKHLHKLYMKDIVKELNTNVVIVYTQYKITFFICDLNNNKYHKLNVF